MWFIMLWFTNSSFHILLVKMKNCSKKHIRIVIAMGQILRKWMNLKFFYARFSDIMTSSLSDFSLSNSPLAHCNILID